MYINENFEITDKTLYKNTGSNIFILVISVCFIIFFSLLSYKNYSIKTLSYFYSVISVLWIIITIVELKKCS